MDDSIFLLLTEDEEDIKFLGHSTESRSVLEALNKRKKSVFTLRKGTTENFMQAIEEVREGRISFLAAGKKYGVSHMTLYRYYLSMGYPLLRRSNRTHHVGGQDLYLLEDIALSRAGEPRTSQWESSGFSRGARFSQTNSHTTPDQDWL